MEKKNIGIGIAIVLAVLVVGYFMFFNNAGAPTVPADQMNNDAEPTTSIETIRDLTHTYDDGEHTLAGVIVLPTPCYSVEEDVQVAESFPEQVTVAFTTAAGDGVCIQVIDEREFEVTFEASRQASVRFIVDGTSVTVPALSTDESDES